MQFLFHGSWAFDSISLNSATANILYNWLWAGHFILFANVHLGMKWETVQKNVASGDEQNKKTLVKVWLKFNLWMLQIQIPNFSCPYRILAWKKVLHIAEPMYLFQFQFISPNYTTFCNNKRCWWKTKMIEAWNIWSQLLSVVQHFKTNLPKLYL